VTGGDEGQVAVGFVAFCLEDVGDGLLGLVVGLVPGKGGLVDDNRVS
jgi:hypothetical protein